MRIKFHILFFSILLTITNNACASKYPRVEQDLKTYDQHIESLNKKFSFTPENLNSMELRADV